MATTFTLRFGGVAHTVKRKFLMDERSISFVELVPAVPDNPPRKAHLRYLRLPSSPFEAEVFPGMGKALKMAAKQCDINELALPAGTHPTIKTIAALRAHANSDGTLKGQGRRFDELSLRLTGLKHSPLIEKLRSGVIEEFDSAFQNIRLCDPTEPSAPKYLFGCDIFADDMVIARLQHLAKQGHAYSQFLTALLLTYKHGGLTSSAVQFLLAAHAQGLPQALPALAERLLVGRYFSDALQCAIVAVASGYDAASSIIDDVGAATFNAMLEMPQGLVPFFHYLVEWEIESDVKKLLMLQRPEWRPKTHEQIFDTMFRRHREGERHV